MQIQWQPEMLLNILERGREASFARRGLMLLAVTHPDLTPSERESISVGRRDSALLALREALFGADLSALTECPACGERVELTLSCKALREGDESEAPGPLCVAEGDWEARFRLPNSGDLAALEETSLGLSTPDAVETGAAHLLERCLASVTCKGASQEPGAIPGELIERIAAAMAAADPMSDIRLSLNCPSCGHGWEEPFDIVPFLWSELKLWAERTLQEIHLIASTYGWTEQQILSLSAERRAAYIERIVG